MSESRPLQLVTKRETVARSTRDELLSLIEKIDAGEVVSVMGIAEHQDGCYSHFGQSYMSRLQSAGALLEAAMVRLNDTE